MRRIGIGIAALLLIIIGAVGVSTTSRPVGAETVVIGRGAIVNARLADMANGRTKCRTTAGTGSPEDCTGAQETALLSAFVASGASHAKGLVPDPGASAGTAKYLREDATWVNPLTPSASADLLDYAKSRAATLVTFTKRMEVVMDDKFLSFPTANAAFGTAFLTGCSGSGAITAAASVRGGVTQVTTGASASSSCQGNPRASAGTFADSIMDDTVAATSKFYVLWRAKLTTTPSATTQFELGLINAGGSSWIGWGGRGASSTTNFRLHKVATTSGVNSTVAFDTNWHIFEMYSTGDTNVCGAVDAETPVCFAPTSIGAVGPFIYIENGGTAAAQTMLLDRAIYITDEI